ncbi:AAA family ATPase [Acaryochloris sp. IP29b_bin.137]|uniref:AAA family ATPase n=1 Tax=Acaryochloris sp. IP29b_bin.137 TaxID=2969217 RepID=UPI00261846D9|nr:AAA family ATPase [Acaryochloris sp. IP29b_bin.137]
MPTLFIFAGLPGTGKTTLSQLLAQQINAVHLRIDTIEQGLRDLCGLRVQGEGYRLAYRIAADNLQLGLNVVADCCNPLELTRREWEQVAKNNAATYANIEVICSNQSEHQCRVESRRTDIPNLQLPTWHDVERREYHEWSTPRIVIDTAGHSPIDSLKTLMAALDDSTTPVTS